MIVSDHFQAPCIVPDSIRHRAPWVASGLTPARCGAQGILANRAWIAAFAAMTVLVTASSLTIPDWRRR